MGILKDSKLLRKFKVWRVERALGIRLLGWQKMCLIYGRKYMICGGRCTGMTYFRILDLLLSEGDTIVISPILGKHLTEAELNTYKVMGADAMNLRKEMMFVKEMLEIKRKLREHFIKTRTIELKNWPKTYFHDGTY